MRYFLILLTVFIFENSAMGQIISRSGFPAPLEDHFAKRSFPCEGEVLLDEYFHSQGVPVGWQKLDRDNANLFAGFDTVYKKGWQSIVDFKDPNNRVLASPSWYADSTVAADDWLVSPGVQIGSNSCLSWVAYSQDRGFGENYEVYVDTVNSIDSMEAHGPLLKVKKEGFFLDSRSLNIAHLANKTVYVAFRHTSKDKFMLVLDDVRISNVDSLDLGVTHLEDFSLKAGDSIRFKAALQNFGSLNLEVKGSLIVTYAIPGVDTVFANVAAGDTFTLAPNDTFRFEHPVIWHVDTGALGRGTYDIFMWASIGEDMRASNDTAHRHFGIEVDVTSIRSAKEIENVKVYPNPIDDLLYIEWEHKNDMKLQLLDLSGRAVISEQELIATRRKLKLNLTSLQRGVYILRLYDSEGQSFVKKLIK